MLLRTKLEIEKWLDKYNIDNYELIEDEKYGYVVNVHDHVDLIHKNLKSIDVKFNIIDGWFDCSNNNLESLEGGPEIVKGDFSCSNNNLKSLKEITDKSVGCPKKIYLKDKSKEMIDNIKANKKYLMKWSNPLKIKSNHEFDKLLKNLLNNEYTEYVGKVFDVEQKSRFLLNKVI